MPIIDFGDLHVFRGVTTYPCILVCGKGTVEQDLRITNVKTLEFESLEAYISENQLHINQARLMILDGIWLPIQNKNLLNKIQSVGYPWENMFRVESIGVF